MRFHSGFALQEDAVFFDALLHKSDFTISGFSYGAIMAFEEALQSIGDAKRIDRLQLFSPAFFQTKSPAFKRLQLNAFVKDEAAYLHQFICNAFAPFTPKNVTYKECTLTQLQELLEFVWSEEKLSLLVNKGVKIEVYLGAKDAIVDTAAAREFFVKYATVTTFQEANHFLQTC